MPLILIPITNDFFDLVFIGYCGASCLIILHVSVTFDAQVRSRRVKHLVLVRLDDLVATVPVSALIVFAQAEA